MPLRPGEDSPTTLFELQRAAEAVVKRVEAAGEATTEDELELEGLLLEMSMRQRQLNARAERSEARQEAQARTKRDKLACLWASHREIEWALQQPKPESAEHYWTFLTVSDGVATYTVPTSKTFSVNWKGKVTEGWL